MHKQDYFPPGRTERCTCCHADLTDVLVVSYPLVMKLSGVNTHTHTHTHIYTHSRDNLFFTISPPWRERCSQQQCKLGKMFWKVAFPRGTSQLCVRARVCVCVFEHIDHSACVCVCVCVCVFMFIPVCPWQKRAVILRFVDGKNRKSV